jgi:hypothetical protein
MNPWTKKKNQIIMVEPFVPVMKFLKRARSCRA